MSENKRIDANEILSKLDIVDVISRYINVTKKGKNYVALCPFHNDTNPSMMISKEKQIFKCFVCGSSGNAISFISKYEKISFRDALYKAAEIAGIQVTHRIDLTPDEFKPYKKCISDLIQYYNYAISTTFGKDALEYCEKRGLDVETRKRFNIGYAPQNGSETIEYLKSCGNSIKIIRDLGLVDEGSDKYSDKNAGRVIFGISNSNGEPIALSARKFNPQDVDSPKYINSPESKIFHKSNVLYNFYYAKDTAKHDGYIYVLEGFMDVIALYKVGIVSAVGLMGTALSKEHLQMLKYLNVEVRLCLDGDDPGQHAMVDIIKKFEEYQIQYRIVKRNDFAKDSDEILSKFGKDKLLEALNDLQTKQDFLLSFFAKSFDLNDDNERKNFVRSIIPNIANISNPLDLEEYCEKIAKISRFSTNSIKDEINRYKQGIKKPSRISQEEDHEDTVSEKIKKYSCKNRKISNLENEMIYQMLRSQDALKYFQNNIQYFYNSIYSDIATYLENYVNEYHDLSIAGLINYISMFDDNVDKQTVIDTIVYYSTDDTSIYRAPSSESLLDKIGTSLKDERENYDKVISIDRKIDSEIDEKKKIDLIAEKARLRRIKITRKGGK